MVPSKDIECSQFAFTRIIHLYYTYTIYVYQKFHLSTLYIKHVIFKITYSFSNIREKLPKKKHCPPNLQ